MVELTCSFNGCKNVVGYHNKTEDSYYCEYCALAMFNPGECTKIGNVSVIRQMLRLSRNLLEKIRDYVNKEELELKWRQPLEQLKVFDVKLEAINDEFENAITKNKIKDFSNIEERSLNIKFQITESEVYRKYLFYKDMKDHKINDETTGLNMHITHIVRDKTSIRFEEEKAVIEEILRNRSILYESKPSINQNFEEIKRLHSEEIETYKQELIEIRQAYEKEKEEWLAQRTELELEINRIESKAENKEENKEENKVENKEENKEENKAEDKAENQSKEIKDISYDAFSSLFNKIIGQSISLNSGSSIAFNLNDEKCKMLIKELSSFRVPHFHGYVINCVPTQSEDIINFMINSTTTQNIFYFNEISQVHLDGNIYFNAIRSVARRTSLEFSVRYATLTAQQFLDIICAAKYCHTVYFYQNIITFDEARSLGSDMDGCKIQTLYFDSAGSSSYSGWDTNPKRFENMIAAFSKCAPLVASLKTLNIYNCNLARSDAEQILKNYNLSKVIIAGV